MSDTIELEKLIEKLEGLTGPNRRVDQDIAEYLGWRVSRDPYWNYFENAHGGGPIYSPPGDELCISRDGRNDIPCDEALPAFTASIDSALTLVPEGYAIQNFEMWPGCLSRLRILETAREPFGEKRVIAWVHGGLARGKWDAEHTIPAIALCIASLRARIAKE